MADHFLTTWQHTRHCTGVPGFFQENYESYTCAPGKLWVNMTGLVFLVQASRNEARPGLGLTWDRTVERQWEMQGFRNRKELWGLMCSVLLRCLFWQLDIQPLLKHFKWQGLMGSSPFPSLIYNLSSDAMRKDEEELGLGLAVLGPVTFLCFLL